MSTQRSMSLEEARRLWRDPRGSTNPLEPEELLGQVRNRCSKFDRMIRQRDLSELGAALLVAAVTVYVAVSAPGWFPKLGTLVLLACLAYVVSRLYRTRQQFQPSSPDLPVAEELRAEIDRVVAQTHLLRHIVRWYLAPLAVGGTVWVASLVPATGLPAAKARIMMAVMVSGSAIIFLAVGAGVAYLNRRAIHNQLDPYRDELEGLLDQVVG